MRKLYSRPLTLFEIDLLHYTSTATDKEYFADALILKAVDERGRSLFNDTKKDWLLTLPKKELEKMYLEMFDNEIAFKDLH
ncbi:MAG: hypothetical protein P8J52_10400 [Gammaproteobacteria bacterium]|nr:hypothetical protein [Gammaproteobacteria bacterium]